ncbi:MAG: hypothetical protein UW22_C0032G0006 [Candidatus Gottesmanbacteria bacterium GW2011_GWB1_44_11c]|uniref:Uncharacterized protein n=2 Tax=Candidatus Gottesmaniibacteriota TaxID=1752720 RepID=A0A0G1IK54_9BACT|nr:MAG: hypothetical protein UW22_C0032G0006 [Candidatus Gottesmanbacteria bacterium GW2011_GWB1_44_11c]KKT59243.1 MAG: hypothetical protein UW52_C0044G0006 [Candidatus Gottesmanbacteria bacterium GW2011_GWA1_44_24b]HCM82363.1 hypothetical protein [Patescibacteria group bacterium]
MSAKKVECKPYVLDTDGESVVAGYQKKSNLETTVVGTPATTEPVLFEINWDASHPAVLGSVPTLGV